MTIIEHPSPNYSERKAGVHVDTILLHHTATAETWSAVDWLTAPVSKVSAHYLVALSGQIIRLVPESLKAWHAGMGRLPWETCPEYDFNHRSIGIEIVNPGDGKTPFTEAQYAALAWLVPDIVRRHGWSDVEVVDAHRQMWSLPPLPSLRAQKGFILGHRDVAPGRKTDPADNFDWARIRESLAPTPRVG